MLKLTLLLTGLITLSSFAHASASNEDLVDYLLSQPADPAEAMSDYELFDVRQVLSREVGPSMQRHSANFRECLQGFTHLRVKVARAGLKVDGGGAVFSDGSKKETSRTREFAAGYTSPWVSAFLLGIRGRCVSSVYVNAQSTEGSEKSLMQIEAKF